MSRLRLTMLTLLMLAAGDAFAIGTFRTVAMKGDPAPGLSTGQTFSLFSTAPAIDGLGGATFFSFASNPQGPALTGVWHEGTNGLQPVAISGEPAPGSPVGVSIASVSSTVAADSQGDVILTARFSNDAFAFLIRDANGLRAVGTTGTPTPDLPGINFGSANPSSVQINGLAQTAFTTLLQGTSPIPAAEDEAVWSEAGGAVLELVVREGTTIPGLNPGETTATLSFIPPAIDDNGRTAFVAQILPQPPTPNGNGLWSKEPQSGLRLVTRVGQSIANHETDFIDSLRLNNEGELAFGARDVLSPSSATIDGLFVEQADHSFRKVVIEGDPAPNSADGIVIASVNTSGYEFNSGGRLVFRGALTGAGVAGTNNEAVWLSDPVAVMRFVMREGDAAPAPLGESPTTFAFAQNFQLNADGYVAFLAGLLATGQVQSSRDGIFVRSPAGDIERIIAEGDQLTVRIGDHDEVRTISNLRLGSSSKTFPPPRFFNDEGQLAFWATFTDSSNGMFVFTPALHGDFNHDGIVDGADYIVWRANGGLPIGYEIWRENYGHVAGTMQSTGAHLAIPEPPLAALLLTGLTSLAGVLIRRRGSL